MGLRWQTFGSFPHVHTYDLSISFDLNRFRNADIPNPFGNRSERESCTGESDRSTISIGGGLNPGRWEQDQRQERPEAFGNAVEGGRERLKRPWLLITASQCTAIGGPAQLSSFKVSQHTPSWAGSTSSIAMAMRMSEARSTF